MATTIKTICEWKSGDGKHTCAIGLQLGSTVWVWAAIDGKTDCTCADPERSERTVNGLKIAGSIGRLGITAERMALLDAAIAQARAEIKEAPAGLRSTRELLVASCRADYSRAERAWEHEEENECFRLRAEEDARCAKALEELKAFDAQHPEVLEAIKREQAEMVNRHAWD